MSWKLKQTKLEKSDATWYFPCLSCHICHVLQMFWEIISTFHTVRQKEVIASAVKAKELHADLKSQNSTEMTSPRCWLITELARIRQFRFELSNWFLLYNYHAILYFTISDFLCAPWLSIHSITCSDFMRIELEFSHRIASFLKRYLGIT